MEHQMTPATIRSLRAALGGRPGRMLLQNGMNTEVLRTNNLLKRHEWEQFDRVVTTTAYKRMVGIGDLQRAGLVFPLENALGTTVLTYDSMTDLTDAEIHMDPTVRSEQDRLTFAEASTPIPVTEKDFQLSIRRLEMARRNGYGIDTLTASAATRKVSEKIEDTLFNGAGTFTFAGQPIPGYTTVTGRITGTIGVSWATDTGANILADVVAMKTALYAAGHYGPYVIYIPAAFDVNLDNDYSTLKGENTIRDRILKVDGIQKIQVSDFMPAGNVVMVEMQPETVRVIEGFQPQLIQWDVEGGMIEHFKVWAIEVPNIRADSNGVVGIAHYS